MTVRAVIKTMLMKMMMTLIMIIKVIIIKDIKNFSPDSYNVTKI